MVAVFVYKFKKPGFQVVAQFGFIALFPGYVIYHYGVAAGWYPAFFGGLFGSVAMVVALFGITYFIKNLVVRSGTVPLLEHTFLILISYMFVWTVGADIVIAGRAYATRAVVESSSTIVIWIAVYFIGVYMRLPERDLGWVFVLLITAVLANFVHAMIVYSSFLGPFLMFSSIQEIATGSATYQGIGRSIVVLIVVLASLPVRFSYRMAVLVGGFFVLLSLGSREHLFVIGFLVVTHVVLLGFRARNLLAGLSVIAAILVATYFSISIFLQTRAAEVLNLSQSNSWQVRLDAFQVALRVIEDNPFFGNFGYHLVDSISYAHNILSAWTEYGVVGFLLFIGLILYALGVSGYRVIFRSSCSPVWLVAFQFNLVALFLAITSEPIFMSVFPALGYGFTVQALRADREERAFPYSPNDRYPGERFSRNVTVR